MQKKQSAISTHKLYIYIIHRKEKEVWKYILVNEKLAKLYETLQKYTRSLNLYGKIDGYVHSVPTTGETSIK